MRQALAKGKRRELRRAMGEGALGHITAQDQAVAILQNAVASCQREIAALAVNHAQVCRITYDLPTDQTLDLVVHQLRRNLEEFKRLALDAHDSQAKSIAALTERVDAFDALTATFWKRLCWVFCE